MTPAPVFLDIAEIVAIHDYQIARFGGAAGLRDVGMLKSAVAMPAAAFDGKYLHPTIVEMAAAYLFHLVENHPFVDGNKRVGAMAALVFLELNGYDFFAPPGDFAALVLQVANGKLLKSEVAAFLGRHSRRR